MRSAVMAAVIGIALFVVPTPVLADDLEGAAGRLAGLRQVSPGSDNYGGYHGSIAVDEGKGVVMEYFWGGSRCSAVGFTDAQIGQLAAAAGNGKLRIVPLFKPGQGATPCLVQVLIVEKKYLGKVPAFPYGP